MSDNIRFSVPPFRKLKGYAFDPSLSLKIDTAFINNITYKIVWENNLKAGPVGEYLEVIDYDPTVKKFYIPVDLNDSYILAQDGLEPSESNPQFHQQMVYAVAMTTIKNFERALGRPILWSARRVKKKIRTENSSEAVDESKQEWDLEYVPKLRIYPHAFRDANAYYSPQKKALLFGYFLAQPAESTIQMPNALVFTCLSHDIIAHETTHAILDGIYRKYTDDTNIDALAFHEAFADIVALFQHFTFPDVLKHQIARTRGDLSSQNLLGQLAQEFGSAIGSYGALRDALGSIDPKTKEWKPKEPNGDEYQTIIEPHERGSILVSAVFEAFITIYKNRVADLLRIASGGTGILPQGELHPDLVNRLATEAAKSAGHILTMCIRALDYCPPIDITFGDYLRAIITADADLVSDDDRDYRLVFIDAFRKRGVYPNNIKNLSIESLCYPLCDSKNLGPLFSVITKFLREFSGEVMYAEAKDIYTDSKKIYNNDNLPIIDNTEEKKTDAREKIFNLTRDYIAGKYEGTKMLIKGLHKRINEKFSGSENFERITGLIFNKHWNLFGVPTSTAYGYPGPSVSVHSLKLASRVGPRGNKSNQIILSLMQETGIRIKTDENGEKSVETFVPPKNLKQTAEEFIMTGAVTLIFDLDTLELKYTIGKPLIDLTIENRTVINKKRALALHHYYKGDAHNSDNFNSYFSLGKQNSFIETFSFLHTH